MAIARHDIINPAAGRISMCTISVNYKNSIINIDYNPSDNESLGDILIKNNIFINMPCGGNGTCGKCTVKISDGNKVFNTLSCKYYPKGSVNVSIPETSYITALQENNITSYTKDTDITDTVTVSADIGSTSVSISLNINGIPTDSHTFPNPTIPYGADVISRIQACISGKAETLSTLLRSGINSAVMLLLKRNKINPAFLSQVVIACNNTMQHILLNLDCTPLSTYPFISKNTVFEKVPYNSIFNNGRLHESFMDNCDADVTIIRAFSTFIGGDIVSGLYSLGSYDYDKTFILLDLGTNAEMVIGNGRHMLCTSAAAGPAFEASNLSCGCACIPGAIDNISLLKTKDGAYRVKYTTIQNKIPTGICGSGVLKLISQMLELGLIDSYGTLSEQYAEEGFTIANSPGKNICLTQKDIRELQLAISAIRTGIDILLTEAHLSAADINTVYISGSFGSALNFYEIKNLNILKPEWLDSPGTIKTAGNTSLNGAVKYVNDIYADKKINGLVSHLDEVLLASHDLFSSLFMDNINFIT